jgi:hypothetical protein
MLFLPPISDKRKRTIKMKNKTLAMVAAVPAIAPKPKIAATIAITRNVMVQRNIRLDFIVK